MLTIISTCYRALFPTATSSLYSSLSSFCNTYTKTVNAATTGFPARVTTGYSTDRQKISSAYSYNPGLATPTSTSSSASCAPTPAGNLTKNGGFECGLAPCIFGGPPYHNYRFSKPGYNSPNEIVIEGESIDNRFYGTLSQDLNVTYGQTYTVTYRTATSGCKARQQLIITAHIQGGNLDTVYGCSLKPGVDTSRSVGESMTCKAPLSPPFFLGFRSPNTSKHCLSPKSCFLA